MPNLTFYIDLLARSAVRSPTSAAPAPIPDFRNPASYAVTLYFQRRNSQATENYDYVRYDTGTPQLKLRRIKAPDYSTFTLDFLGYTSPVIDARLPLHSIEALIGSIPSVGVGNVQVSGDYLQGFTVEFVGDQASYVQPSFTGRVISPSGGEVKIKQIAAGGSGINAVQTIQLRDAPLAVATGWAEVGVPDTPGWAGTLNTTSVPQDVFDRGDLALEVGLDASGVRTGTDGITVYESTTRSGTDGQIVAGPTDSAVTVFPVVDAPTGRNFLVARDGSTVYGRLFTASDIGRPVTETGSPPLPMIPAETTISDVINTEFYNAAVLSAPFAVVPSGETIQVDLAGGPTKIFKSASAAFVFDDIGHTITGDNIPAGTVIDQWTDAQTVVLSQAGTAAGAALSWTLTALPDDVFQSASAVFTPGDVGARLESPALPAGVYVTRYIDGTHVGISARAVTVATAQAWTLKPKAGGFGVPVVTSIQAGTLGQHEIQQIAFNQQPISGYVKIRDGADSSLPWVNVPAPLSAVAIEGAINAVYVNFLGVQVTEIVPDGEYQVEWGINGLQHLLVVDQSNALFDTLLAQIPVGQPLVSSDGADSAAPSVAAFTHSLARRTVGGLYLLGVPATGKWKVEMSRAVFSPTSDGTNGRQVRQRFAEIVVDYVVPTVGELFSNPAYRLDRHDNIEDRGGLRMYDWVGYKVPSPRSEYVQQSKPVMGVAKSTLNGRLVDIQLYSYSFSTWVRADYKYMVGAPGSGLPPDGPWGILVHFTGVGGFSGQTFLYPSSFSGTSGRTYTQSWTRRRWHADIFEQVAFVG